MTEPKKQPKPKKPKKRTPFNRFDAEPKRLFRARFPQTSTAPGDWHQVITPEFSGPERVRLSEWLGVAAVPRN